ncbi:hypothetical protein BJ742DRAFT_779904 [Cladochytrium replicatum]|nr:hypothetical protein BJ742DRAFT_779904 [Cladochytrium replicatum]
METKSRYVKRMAGIELEKLQRKEEREREKARGTLFAGISVGANTFGRERMVFWCNTAAGMPTLPYFLAKIIADIPRILISSVGMIYFALNAFLLNAAAFAMGYFLTSIMSYRSVTVPSRAFVFLLALVFNWVWASIGEVGKNPETAEALCRARCTTF